MTRAMRLAALYFALALLAAACGGNDNQPLPPETIDIGLNFPDGLRVLPIP